MGSSSLQPDCLDCQRKIQSANLSEFITHFWMQTRLNFNFEATKCHFPKNESSITELFPMAPGNEVEVRRSHILKDLGELNKMRKKGKERKQRGLPWWLIGEESLCQCRRHRLNPWSGRIAYTEERLSPGATTPEPML